MRFEERLSAERRGARGRDDVDWRRFEDMSNVMRCGKDPPALGKLASWFDASFRVTSVLWAPRITFRISGL